MKDEIRGEKREACEKQEIGNKRQEGFETQDSPERHTR